MTDHDPRNLENRLSFLLHMLLAAMVAASAINTASTAWLVAIPTALASVLMMLDALAISLAGTRHAVWPGGSR